MVLFLLTDWYCHFNSSINARLLWCDISVSGGDSVIVQIEKIQDAFGADDFKGFIVQGVKQGSNEILGTFNVKDDE